MSTLPDLLNLCNTRGVRLANVGGELKLRAPDGAITPEIVSAAAAHKPTLLAVLTPEPPADAGRDAEAGQAGGVPAPAASPLAGCDWRHEWLWELGRWMLYYSSAGGEAARRRILAMTAARPRSVDEWMVVAAVWAAAERDLLATLQVAEIEWPGVASA